MYCRSHAHHTVMFSLSASSRPCMLYVYIAHRNKTKKLCIVPKCQLHPSIHLFVRSFVRHNMDYTIQGGVNHKPAPPPLIYSFVLSLPTSFPPSPTPTESPTNRTTTSQEVAYAAPPPNPALRNSASVRWTCATASAFAFVLAYEPVCCW